MWFGNLYKEANVSKDQSGYFTFCPSAKSWWKLPCLSRKARTILVENCKLGRLCMLGPIFKKRAKSLSSTLQPEVKNWRLWLQVIFSQITIFCHQLIQDMTTDFVEFYKYLHKLLWNSKLANLSEFLNSLCKSS